MASRGTKLVYVNNPVNSMTPDFMVKSAWVSTALALVLTTPPVALLVGIVQFTDSLILGAAVGFGLHFVLLALSGKISTAMSRLFED